MPVQLGEGYRGPDGRMGYLLRQAHQALRGAIDEVAREAGITAPQYSILSVLDHEPGLSGADVARQSLLRTQSVNEILVVLERRGLVERHVDPDDRRRRRVDLTPDGRAVFAEVDARVRAIEERVFDEKIRRPLAEQLVNCALALRAE
jgi:DNA-binding MarR family transcriptional regulator